LPPSSSPIPRFIALYIFSFGILIDLASSLAYRNRKFRSGSPLPNFAATIIDLLNRLHSLPLLLSTSAFLRFIPAQCECPAMTHLRLVGELSKCLPISASA
jgi:hypothetical protein